PGAPQPARGGTGSLTHLAHLEPPARDLHVKVGLCPAWKLFEHLVLPDRLSDGFVHVVVPASRGLRQRNRAAQLQADEVAMSEDVLEDLVVATQPAAFESCCRAGVV